MFFPPFILQVLSNGVRLSSNLSCTLGYPTSGRIIFVYPIQGQSTMGVNGNVKLNGPSTKCLSLSNCNELYLGFVSAKRGFTDNGSTLSGRDFSEQRTRSRSENKGNSSPMTPVCSQSKLSSLVTSQSSLPRYEESRSSSPNLCETSFDAFKITEVLGDDSAKKLLQSCAATWLCSRILLYGNFVTIPILSKICIFQVIGAHGMSVNCTNQDLTDKSIWDLCCDTPDNTQHVQDAFVVNHKTKVHLFSTSDSSVETPQRRVLPCLELESEGTIADVVDDSLKLGGLAKEYAVLKDIIDSSVKDTLSRYVYNTSLHIYVLIEVCETKMLNKVDWQDKSRFPFLISWICIRAFLWQVVSNILHLLSCHLVHIYMGDLVTGPL